MEQETKFKITTQSVKEMGDTTYRVVSSTGRGVTVRCDVRENWNGDAIGYEYHLGQGRRWTYPHYAIVKAIRHLKGDVVRAEISYKRRDQIQILRTALYRERVIKKQYASHYLDIDDVEIVPATA